MRGAGFLVAASTAAFVLAGCMAGPGSEGGFGIPSPNNIPCVESDATGVDNTMGAFSYGGAVSCKTETESYDWANPMPRAAVSWGGAVAKGKVTVAVMDSLDRKVYGFTVDGTGAEGANGSTEIGLPGPMIETWSVEVVFENFTGTVGLDLASTM